MSLLETGTLAATSVGEQTATQGGQVMVRNIQKAWGAPLVIGLAMLLAVGEASAATTWNVPGDSSNTCTILNPSCDTIAGAVAAASGGDTIALAAGAHNTTAQILIAKDLTMTGAGPGATTITLTFDTGSSGDSRGWFLVDSGKTLTLSGVTMDGSGQKVWQAIRHKGQGTIDNCELTNIKYDASGPSYAGTGIAAFGTGNVDVTNSTFSQIGRVGILYFGPTITGSTYSANTYTGKGVGDFLDYGVEVGAGAKATISDSDVSGNLGVASVDGSSSAGILVTTYYGSGTEATITGNSISGSTTGIAVGYDGSDTSTAAVHHNSFTGNTDAVDSTAPAVDAEGNWYDSATGPTHATNGGGTGEVVSDDVDYSPWLASGTDCNLVTPGFQVCTTYVVNANNPPTYVNGGIQDGVDFASPGDTVQAVAGTYNESVVVDKAATIESTAGPAATFVVGASTVFAIDASGVTVDGFDISNGHGANEACVFIGKTAIGVRDTTVTNNVIHDCNYCVYLYRTGAGLTNTISGNEIFDCVDDDPPVGGVGIILWEDNSDAVISSNDIHDTDRQGIFLGFSDDSVATSGNQVSLNAVHETGKETLVPSDTDGYGIQLWNADSNTIQLNAISHASAAADLTHYFNPGLLLSFGSDLNLVTCNSVQDYPVGLSVGCCGLSSLSNVVNFNTFRNPTAGAASNRGVRIEDELATSTVVNDNRILGYPSATRNAGVTTVNMENNWWGCAAGPSGLGCDAVTGPIDFSPFLTSDPGDADNDGFIDFACETDSDNDGVPDLVDNCSTVPNPGQEDADADLIGDACDTCTDTDGDGFGNPGFPVNTCADDNCPWLANLGQEDLDGDGDGNVCDANDDAGSLSLRRAQMSNVPPPGKDRWSAEGELNSNGQATFVADVDTNGVTVAIGTTNPAATLDTETFGGTDCHVTPAGMVRCKNAGNSRIRFSKRGAVGFYKVAISVRGKDLIVPPVAQTPLRVTLSTAPSIDRPDDIDTCAAPANNPAARIVCRDLP